MKSYLLVALSAAIAAIATIAIIVNPLAAVGAVGLFSVLSLFFFAPKDKVGSITVAAAITLVVAVPSSEFSGSFRQALSVGAAAVLMIGYFRSSIRRPVSKTAWLVPLWLALLGLGDMSSDGALKWIVYCCLVVSGLLAATRSELRSVLRFLVGLAIVQSLVAILQVTVKVKLPWEQITAISGNELLGGAWLRGSGTMGHPLPLTFLLVAAFAVVIRDQAWLPKILRVMVFAILSVGVVTAGSRSGLLILLGLLLFAAGKKMSLHRAFFGGVTAAVGALLLVLNGFFESAYVSKILVSGSVYHRQGALDAVVNLLTQQDAKELFIGHGYSGVSVAFDLGLLQSDGFRTVDNQFVTLMVTSGVIGALVFIALILRAFQLGASSARWVLLASVGMFMIFDVLLWSSTTLLLVTFIGLALSSAAPVAPSLERHGDERLSTRVSPQRLVHSKS